MEQIVHKSSHLLKRTLQFLLSLSLFSLLVCYSAGFSFDPHSFNVCLSTLLFSLFTRTIHRKYLFLICNGILVFLAKTSSSPLSDLSEKPSATSVDDQQFIIASVDDTTVAIVAEDQEHKEVEEEEEEEVEEGEDLSLFTSNNESEDYVIAEEDTKRAENWSVMKQEIEDMDAPNEELLNTDELNKKVEEFIRKMKEEIRIEAQQHLIAV